jgi:hypothetical protein
MLADHRMSSPSDIASLIVVLRGQRVLLDSDLARLYGVPVKALKQAVRRNRVRFPDDFLIEPDEDDLQFLRSQFVTLENSIAEPMDRRGRHAKYLPFAFTEQGVAMLSSVLRSERAILVNIAIMRAFVQMRRLLATHADLARKVEELERSSVGHDARIREIFAVLRRLFAEPEPAPVRPAIGFRPPA